MKKIILLVCVVAIAFLSISCIGWESGVVSTKTDQIVNNKTTKIQAKINQVVMKKWFENNRACIHVAVEIENIGKQKFKIEDIELEIISKEGKILNNDYDSYSIFRTYPSIFYHNDVGYAGETFVLNNITNLDDIAKAEVTVYYTQTLRAKTEILVKNVEIVPFTSQYTRKGFIVYPEINVKVSVLNNTNRTINNFTICVILYDKDNQILAVLGSEFSNELEASEESFTHKLFSDFKYDEIYPKIKTVKSFCWTYSGGY